MECVCHYKLAWFTNSWLLFRGIYWKKQWRFAGLKLVRFLCFSLGVFLFICINHVHKMHFCFFFSFRAISFLVNSCCYSFIYFRFWKLSEYISIGKAFYSFTFISVVVVLPFLPKLIYFSCMKYLRMTTKKKIS